MLNAECRRQKHDGSGGLACASLGLLTVIFLIPTPVWPCSVEGPLRTPDTLVREADVIVRVRADSAAPSAVQVQAGTEAASHINFTVLEILKGEVPSGTLRVNGVASERDDHNDTKVPYDFVRPAGRHGNCFALEYRIGGEYLLLLKRTANQENDPPTFTPYWAALGPTNEQLFDRQNDPWLRWVRERVTGGQPRGAGFAPRRSR